MNFWLSFKISSNKSIWNMEGQGITYIELLKYVGLIGEQDTEALFGWKCCIP